MRTTVARSVNAGRCIACGDRVWWRCHERASTTCVIRMVTASRPLTRKSLHIDAGAPGGSRVDILKALSSEPRIAILRYLGDRLVPVNQIAQDLGLPASTAAMHILV